MKRSGIVEFLTLSRRERQVVALIVRGHMDKEVANHLGVAVRTVRTHIEHIYRKLNVTNRAQLLRLLRRDVLAKRRHQDR